MSYFKSFLLWIVLPSLFTSCCWFCDKEINYLEICEKYDAARWAHYGYAEMGGKRVDPLAFSEVIIPYAFELSRTKRLRFEDSKVYFTSVAQRFRVIFSTQNILEICEAR